MPDPRVAEALRRGGLIDITTTGRQTGRPRRIEIVFFGIDGRVYITGSPGSRGWLANLQADPRLTFHLKRGVVADLPATARIVTDPAERRMVVETACRPGTGSTTWRPSPPAPRSSRSSSTRILRSLGRSRRGLIAR